MESKSFDLVLSTLTLKFDLLIISVPLRTHEAVQHRTPTLSVSCFILCCPPRFPSQLFPFLLHCRPPGVSRPSWLPPDSVLRCPVQCNFDAVTCFPPQHMAYPLPPPPFDEREGNFLYLPQAFALKNVKLSLISHCCSPHFRAIQKYINDILC